MYPKQIIDALEHVRYPGTDHNIVELGMVEDDIRISGYKVAFSLIFVKPNDPFKNSIVKAAQQAIQVYVDDKITVEIKVKESQATMSPKEEKRRVARHVIGIHSGKGGVGKSTIASNLAVIFAQMGFKVGLIDADIHGPSLPKMFHCEDYQPVSVEEDGRTLIEPITKYGVRLLSLGFFINPDQAIVWRGGMASNAIKQMLNEGHWGELDYLFIDFPPGTSDIHLTVLQSIDLQGVIIVTTPQPIALTDAQRGIDMFNNEKLNIPILGLIENMAWFTPDELPDNKYFIFGKDGGKNLAYERQLNFLGQVPIVQSIRESGDEGKPIVLQNEKMNIIFASIARTIIQLL